MQLSLMTMKEFPHLHTEIRTILHPPITFPLHMRNHQVNQRTEVTADDP